MLVLHPDKLLDITRFQTINIDAKEPAQVYGKEHRADGAAEGTTFLGECLRRLARVEIILPDISEPATSEPVLVVNEGRLVDWRSPEALDSATRLAIESAVGKIPVEPPAIEPNPADRLEVPLQQTLGAR
jgi:hypothetical protein